MVKKLYLMRHGQTRFNQQSRIQGASDSPLTDLGIAQAEAAGVYFTENKIHFDKVYASTQERACDTAEIVSGGQDYTRLKDLKEWDFGVFEAQQDFLTPPLQGAIGYGDFFVAYGGESYQDVRKRVGKAIRDIMEEATDNSTTLIVSHSATISQFYSSLIYPFPKVALSNCAILDFNYENSNFDLLNIYSPYEKDYLYQKNIN